MPSPRKRAAALATSNKQKLKVKVAGVSPARQSSRIKANAEIKVEAEDEENQKKRNLKSKGKGKPNQTKKKVEVKSSAKMSVLALAAARKRKLMGEDDDDDEPVQQKKVKKKPTKKKVKKKPKKATTTTSRSYENSIATENMHDDEDTEDNEEDEQTMVAIKHENQMLESMVGDENDIDNEEDANEMTTGYEEDQNDDDDDEDDDEEQQNLLISEEHQYIEQMRAHQEIIEQQTEIEVPQEQVQAELQQEDPTEENEDDDDEQDDDEDIDENLFFGIPEQRSPELATCTHCKGKFRKDDVHEHMLTCPERYVQCRECGKILSNLQTLERHHKRFHLKIREVPCTLCDKMFIDEAAARKHLKTVHFKVKNFHCPHCDKSFSQRNKLTYHVRTHSGEKPYSCAECGRSFSLLWNLKTHLRTHTGEKPYACDTCGRRFTQKQNMTSHLTTHRKPKTDKAFRNHFPTDLDDFDTSNSSILNPDFTTKQSTVKNYRAFEQAKQLNAQSIGSGHYVLGDMQSIEVHTAAAEQEASEQANVSLEHGLGLLSSVARKGDTDVQVDGIVNIPENQLATSGSNLDQVVEVMIRSNGETDSAGNPMTTLQLGNGNQAKIVLDPNTQSITDGDGQEIPLDTNTAAGLANILQNPDVLAAINSAASSNKFIVIGPVSMFDGSTSQASSAASLSTADSAISADATSTFSQEQLAQISAMVEQNPGVVSQVSSQTVNDSISATSALAAVESYLQGEQPTSSLTKPDAVVSNILGSIQPDGKRGPSAVLQSAQANMSRASNLTISMPPMTQSSLTISPPVVNADSTQRMKHINLQNNVASSSEVSSSVDNMELKQHQQMTVNQQQIEAESTTQPVEFIAQNFVDTTGAADSSNMAVGDGNLVVDDGSEASSSGEPILMLSTDENGQPQIIVKMPDGSETIMSDPALAESLIQVPTITNAEMEAVSVNANEMEAVGVNNEAEATQTIHMDQMTNAIQLQMADQGIPSVIELPTQSNIQSQVQASQQEFVTQSSEVNEGQQLPDQGLATSSTISLDETVPNNDVDSSENAQIMNYTQENLITDSTVESTMQAPDSSSQSYEGVVTDSQIDSRQGVFVMEHVTQSNQQQQQPQQSEHSTGQNNIDFDEPEKSEFQVDSSSNSTSDIHHTSEVSGSDYLQMDDVSQSTNTVSAVDTLSLETENVSSTEQE